MLEQLQNGISGEGLPATTKKGGKKGAAGIFANLFAALNQKQAHQAKGLAAQVVGKDSSGKSGKTLIAISKLSGKASEKSAAGKTGIKTTTDGQLAPQPTQNTALKSQHAQRGQQEDAVAAVLPIPASSTGIQTRLQLAHVENGSASQADKSERSGISRQASPTSGTLSAEKGLIQEGKQTAGRMNKDNYSANPTGSVADTTDTKASTPPPQISDVGNAAAQKNGRLSLTDKPTAPATTGQTPRDSAARSANDTQYATLVREISAKPDAPHQAATRAEQRPEVAHAGGNRTKGSDSLTAQTMAGERAQTESGRSERGPRAGSNANTTSAANTTANLTAVINQNGTSPGNGSNSQASPGNGWNAPNIEGTVKQETADARFQGVIQGEARALDQQAPSQQRLLHPNQPLKTFEAMQHIARAAGEGATRIELQLEPAHLGRIHVSLQSDAAKQLQVHLTVEQPLSRQVIEQHLPQLRAALEQQGLSLDQFSLQTGSQQQHTAGDQDTSRQNAADNRSRKEGVETQPIHERNASTAAHGLLSIHV